MNGGTAPHILNVDTTHCNKVQLDLILSQVAARGPRFTGTKWRLTQLIGKPALNLGLETGYSYQHFMIFLTFSI
jgi:hypothetical protein